jgi:hypothetical protein
MHDILIQKGRLPKKELLDHEAVKHLSKVKKSQAYDISSPNNNYNNNSKTTCSIKMGN